MIRVMVVEDEPPIAQSIKRLVEEYDSDIQVMHMAFNGQRALEYLRSHQVDLVFSDIRMPVMDGLELARHLYEEYPHITMIIISGFQEFEFARTALRYGVTGYLLKPVSRAHVAEVLDSACMEIRQQAEDRLRALLERGAPTTAAPPLPDGELCGAALLCAGSYPLIPDEGLPESWQIWTPAEIEAHLRAVLTPEETCICVPGKSLRERAVVFSAREPGRVRTVASDLYDYLAASWDAAVTVAVWEQPVPLTGAAEVFRQLRSRIYRHIRVFRSQLLLDGGGDTAAPDTAAQQTGLVAALQTKDSHSIREAVAQLVEACIHQSARQTELLLCLEKTLMGFFDGVLSLRQMDELKFELQSAVSASLQPGELVEELGQLLTEWSGAGRALEQDALQSLCEEVAAYLRVNYRENIRGADLAKKFGFSAAQLAKQFKACFGLSISEYVNHFRIETAQAIMRNNKKMMVKEIALEVGYNDQYYFSKLFKKFTGVWPSEYQRNEAAV